jgi:O-acetyl-ADP-ribose deacetylase (regulator of RNase III)
MKAVRGDITKLAVDAIVNAANSSLLGGGGVDGAIHRAAGPDLFFECRLLGGCKTGEAKITKGYKLPAKHVIHTVGPVWNGGTRGEAEKLADCYRHSLDLAVEHSLTSIAFPAISTGIYGYPVEEAAEIAVRTVGEYVREHPLDVTFCCFSAKDLEIYQAELATEE